VNNVTLTYITSSFQILNHQNIRTRSWEIYFFQQHVQCHFAAIFICFLQTQPTRMDK